MSSVNTQANCRISWFIHPTALTNHCLTPAHSNYRPSTCVSTFVSALADSTMPALCTVLDEPLVPRSVLIASWCLCSFRSFSVASARCCILLRECFGRSDAVTECNVVYCMLHLHTRIELAVLWLVAQPGPSRAHLNNQSEYGHHVHTHIGCCIHPHFDIFTCHFPERSSGPSRSIIGSSALHVRCSLKSCVAPPWVPDTGLSP